MNRTVTNTYVSILHNSRCPGRKKYPSTPAPPVSFVVVLGVHSDKGCAPTPNRRLYNSKLHFD